MGPQTNRRHVAVRWTSSSEDGDAGEAVAEIDAWLMKHPADEADWGGVLGQLRDALLRASVEPLLMGDVVARGMILDLASEADAEALDAALEALGKRVDDIVAARERRALGKARVVEDLIADSRGPQGSRTIFRI